MRAVVITKAGGPDVLQIKDAPAPRPAVNEILVAVKAAGVNRLDLLQRMGMYPAPPDAPQDIPGVEYAGCVAACGEGAGIYRPGDRVFGLAGGGAYAEYLAVHELTAMRIPDVLSFAEAAAIPEAYVTAYDALIRQAHLQAGDTALIHAVGSGVGSAAVQICCSVNAQAIGTARSAGKIDAASALGLTKGILPSDGRFAEQVMTATGNRGVDVVLDLVGGAYVPESMACMASQGTMIVVGLVGGVRAEIDLGLLLRKRLKLRGTVLRARSLEEKIAVTQDFARDLLPLIAESKLKPVVHREFPLSKAAEAHTLMAGNENFGKIILLVSDES